MANRSSRYLFGGYRCESPLAGMQVWTTPLPAGVPGRQGGLNFAGLHYTLHRHYDPVLMRFTGPDPVASPFYNLHAYCGNNPAGFFDPDGLARKKKFSKDTFTADVVESGLDIVEGVLTKTFGSMALLAASGGQMANGADFDDTYVGQGFQDMAQRYDARASGAGGGAWGHLNGIGGLFNDTTGVTGISESFSGRDSITGRQLTGHQRYERFVDGASSGILFGGSMVTGAPVAGAVTRLATKAATAGMKRLANGARILGNRIGEALAPPANAAIRFRMSRSGNWLFGPARPAGHGAAARSLPGLSDLGRFRSQLGLAPGQGTLARLDVGGRSFYGINAHGQPVTLRVNAITRTHAEADAFQQAASAGVRGGRATLYVDRALCPACGRNGGIRGMAGQLGLSEVTVVTPQGIQVIRP